MVELRKTLLIGKRGTRSPRFPVVAVGQGWFPLEPEQYSTMMGALRIISSVHPT
jgi:hypothetical protein